MSKHLISRADTIFSGSSYYAKYNKEALPVAGTKVDFPLYYSFGAVVGADRDGLVTSVDPASGATLTLRSTVTGMTNTGGVVTLDTPRNVTIYSAADQTTRSISVTGTDEYGEPLKETITGPDGTSAVKISAGNKAFKTISSIVATGDFGTIEVGFGDKIGLPFRVDSAQKILPIVNGDVAAPHILTSTIAAIGTAQSTAVISPIGGFITKVSGVSAAANATASSTVTVTNQGSLAGAVASTTVVFTSAYAAYAAQASTAINNASIPANGVLRIDTDGTGDGAGQATISVQVDPAVVTPAVDTAATATTGDIRGTVNFGLIPDGSKVLGVLLLSPTRTTKELAFGVTQFAG